jgi:hypothetical protein
VSSALRLSEYNGGRRCFPLLIIRDSTARPIDRRVEVGLALLPVLKETPVEPLVLTPAELTDRLKIGDQFFREIMTKGKVLYERGRVNCK